MDPLQDWMASSDGEGWNKTIEVEQQFCRVLGLLWLRVPQGAFGVALREGDRTILKIGSGGRPDDAVSTM